jgi:phosphoribosylformylglycinamidine synthase
VQIGDPFEEKKLLECSLELLEREAAGLLQDLGAAGLTSSAAEMAAKGEVGIDLDVRQVPLREADMEPFEIMISESQERMLCVVEPERLAAVLAVCDKWEVNATAIGEVTDSGGCACSTTGRWSATSRSSRWSTSARPTTSSPHPRHGAIYPPPRRRLEDGLGAAETLIALLSSANLASRRWAFEQYDCIVGSRTVRRPEQSDAAVLMLEGGSALAVSIDGNGRRVAVDPYRGAVEAVLECSANLACAGAEPLGLTNCLNFGNPEKPHIAWQFTRAVAGLGDACRALGVPVVGGNVSLYNEGAQGPIYPTPVVGMVGELPDPSRAGRLGFSQEGDAVALIAAGWAPAAAGSELAKLRGEPIEGELPAAELGEIRALHAAVRRGVRSGALRSAHDVAEGGLAVALAECCLAGGLGALIDFGAPADDALLFGEGPGAFVVSGPRDALAHFGAAAKVLGSVGGGTLRIEGVLEIALVDLERAHTGGLADLLR